MATISGLRDELTTALQTINKNSGDSLWQQGHGRNMIAITEAQIKLLEIEQAKDSSDAQRKQSKALIFWTKAMVFVIALQILVLAFQGWVYYQQLKVMQKSSQHP